MISVIMPAYNSEKFIEPAIESILNQTYKDFEFIIVDDGSTDRTPQIIAQYAAQDNRIRVIQGTHEGVGKAMNTALKAATRPWVAVMHSDDIAMPERLEKQIEAAQKDADVVIWGTDGYHINSQGNILSRFRVGPTTKEESRERRRTARIVQAIHPTVMLNRDVALKVGGYDESLKVCEDIELFDRMLVHGDLVTLTDLLMKYRIHGSSLAMTKYLAQAVYDRYVKARQLHRLETGEELSFEAFKAQDNQRPTMTKFNQYRKSVAELWYRRAGMAYGEKQYLKTGAFLVLSALLRPMYPFKRAWSQVLSPSARQKVRSAAGH